MIAVRIRPLARIVAVASPSCFENITPPHFPQDLSHHRAINFRLPSLGGFYVWEFEKDGQEVRVRVDGQVAFNEVRYAIKAALDGYGIAYLHEDVVIEHIESGRLVRVMDDWCPRFPGYHLYYPSRRLPSPAFTLLLDTLRSPN